MSLKYFQIFNSTQEMENALQYNRIRLMRVEQYASNVELAEPIGISLQWTAITPGRPKYSSPIVMTAPGLLLKYVDLDTTIILR